MPHGVEADSRVIAVRGGRFSQCWLALVLLLEKMSRGSHRHGTMRHYFRMHIAVFLLGIGIAVVVAFFGVFKNSRSLEDDIIISHSAQDDDALL
jgi:hypothetical protein